MNNLDALKDAGVITADCEEHLTDDDRTAIGSLTEEEVASMISGGQKLGQKFFERMCPHGIFF